MTSALPHRLEMERLPCLATFTPAPATTNAATVEMLKVRRRRRPCRRCRASGSASGPASTRWALSRIARAKPTSSSPSRPFMRMATRNAAICAVDASPARIDDIAFRASIGGEVRPRHNCVEEGRIDML